MHLIPPACHVGMSDIGLAMPPLPAQVWSTNRPHTNCALRSCVSLMSVSSIIRMRCVNGVSETSVMFALSAKHSLPNLFAYKVCGWSMYVVF